jgi:zinc protease
MRRLGGVVAGLLAGLFLLGSAHAAPLYGETGFALANGLQVVVIPNHRAPTVTHWVWYKAGAADEQRGKSGAAHFLEHLMFRGTKTVKPKEFSELIARVGGEENAFTSWDYTAFHQTVSADQLDLVMRLEADRMQNLVITEDQLKPERSVVLEEWNMRTGDQPSGLLEIQLDAALYLNSQYRIPVLGWRNEIETLDVPDEQWFYNTWYAPNNAILIVAGDVTVDQVRALAEKYYGPIPSHPVPERHRLEEPARSADTTVRLADPRVRQLSWSREYLAPSYRTAGDDEPYALMVLADVLGGGAASRLHKEFVLERSLATDAVAEYDASRYDTGRLLMEVDARPKLDAEQIQTAVDAMLSDILAHGFSADEIARAKKRLVTDELYAQDSLTQPVEIIGRALTTGRTLAELDAWPAKINAVTPEQVNAAMHKLFEHKTSVTGILLPEAGAANAPPPPRPPSSAEIR